MDRVTFAALRLQRQGLSAPVDASAGYDELFARLQPVAPMANAYPGSPPRLQYRFVDGDDGEVADLRRANRCLVKGRFFGGREVLKYLLVGGDLHGAVHGHWRIGPHDVEDIAVDGPARANSLRQQIIAAVAAVYPSPQRILHFEGEPI